MRQAAWLTTRWLTAKPSLAPLLARLASRLALENRLNKDSKAAGAIPGPVSWTLMASSNSPTRGHPKFPQAARSDYDGSVLIAIRAAASLSL